MNIKMILVPTFLTVLFAGCSKSPVQTGVEATTGLVKQALAPLNPKDASAQAERLVSLLADRPDAICIEICCARQGAALPLRVPHS